MARARQMGFVGRYHGVKRYGVVDAETGQIGSGEPLTGEDYDRVYAAMNGVVYQLRQGLTIARDRVADAAPSTVARIAAVLTSLNNPLVDWVSEAVEAQSEVARNVDNGLLAMERQIQMREDEEADVLAGRLDASRWYLAAQSTADGIVSILATLGDYSTGNIVKAEIAQAKKDFAIAVRNFIQQVEQAAKITGGVLLALAVGAALLLWPIAKQVLLSYVPQRRLQGILGPGRRLRGHRRTHR